MFRIKEKVFYPGHGVALIDDITENEVGSTKIHFVKLNFIHKDMTIFIPLNTVEHSGVRYLGTPIQIDEALEELHRPPERKFESIDFTPSGWNRRNKEYQSKIQSGKLREVARIYRDLMYIARQKELSFGEKTLLATTEDLIVQGVMEVRNQDRASVVHDLRTPFRQYTHSFDESNPTTPTSA